ACIRSAHHTSSSRAARAVDAGERGLKRTASSVHLPSTRCTQLFTTAVLTHGVAAGLDRRDDSLLLLALFVLIFGVHSILGSTSILSAVKCRDETAVVDLANVMQVPQLHGIDRPRILVFALGLFINVLDRSHARIETRLQQGSKLLIDVGGLLLRQRPFL